MTDTPKITEAVDVAAWVDRTLALPVYANPELGSFADGVVTALKTVKKLLARADAVEAQTEPPAEEWAWRDEDGHVWPFGDRDQEEGETLEACEEAVRGLSGYFTGNETLNRRTKATAPGPWEPVSPKKGKDQ